MKTPKAAPLKFGSGKVGDALPVAQLVGLRLGLEWCWRGCYKWWEAKACKNM